MTRAATHNNTPLALFSRIISAIWAETVSSLSFVDYSGVVYPNLNYEYKEIPDCNKGMHRCYNMLLKQIRNAAFDVAKEMGIQASWGALMQGLQASSAEQQYRVMHKLVDTAVVRFGVGNCGELCAEFYRRMLAYSVSGKLIRILVRYNNPRDAHSFFIYVPETLQSEIKEPGANTSLIDWLNSIAISSLEHCILIDPWRKLVAPLSIQKQILISAMRRHTTGQCVFCVVLSICVTENTRSVFEKNIQKIYEETCKKLSSHWEQNIAFLQANVTGLKLNTTETALYSYNREFVLNVLKLKDFIKTHEVCNILKESRAATSHIIKLCTFPKLRFFEEANNSSSDEVISFITSDESSTLSKST